MSEQETTEQMIERLRRENAQHLGRIGQYEAEKHKWQSEQGRLAKEQQRAQQAEAEAAELRARIASLGEGAALPDGLNEAIGADNVGGLKSYVERVAREAAYQGAAAAYGQTKTLLDAERAQSRFREGVADWESATGARGIFRRIAEGGDLAASWAEFKDSRPAVTLAERSMDAASLTGFVDLFMKSKGITFEMTPQPMSLGGGFPQGAGAAPYTEDDYLTDMNALSKARMDGVVKPADYDRHRAHLRECLKAGRLTEFK